MSSHRLHDFVELGKRVFSAAGVGPEEFERLMDGLRQEQGAEFAAGDSFITATRAALRGLVKSAPVGAALPGYKSWFPTGWAAVRLEGSGVIVGFRARSILDRLRMPLGMAGGDWLPKNERELAGALFRTTPIFGDIGIKVGRRELSKGHPYWEFMLTPEAVKELHRDGE